MDFGAEFVLEYDRCQKGYYYTRPTFRVPGHLTTAKQIVAARLMQNLIESLHGTPLYNQAIEVFANFSDNIEPDTKISLGKELSKKISFVGMEPVQISNEVWDNIETALAKKQASEERTNGTFQLQVHLPALPRFCRSARALKLLLNLQSAPKFQLFPPVRTATSPLSFGIF